MCSICSDLTGQMLLKEPLQHLESWTGHLMSGTALLIAQVNAEIKEFYHSSLSESFKTSFLWLAHQHVGPLSTKHVFIKNWEHIVFKNKPYLTATKLLILECFILAKRLKQQPKQLLTNNGMQHLQLSLTHEYTALLPEMHKPLTALKLITFTADGEGGREDNSPSSF